MTCCSGELVEFLLVWVSALHGFKKSGMVVGGVQPPPPSCKHNDCMQCCLSEFLKDTLTAMMGRVSFEVSLCGSNNSKKVGGGGATPICTHNDWMTPGGSGWICTAVISGCRSCFLSFSCTFFLQCSCLCLSLVPSFAYLSSLLDFLHLSVFLPSIDLYSFISACRSLSMSLSCSVCPPFHSSFCRLHVFRGSFFRWFWIAFLLVVVAFALLCFGGIVPKHRPKLGRPCGLSFWA